MIAVAASYFFTLGRAPNFQHLAAGVVGDFGLGGLFIDWAISRNIQRSGGVQAMRSGGVLSTGPVATAGRLWAQGEGFRIFGLNEDAKKNYQEAAQLFKEANEQEGYADTRISLGQLEAATGNADEARKIFTDTIEVYKTAGKARGQGQGFLDLGLLDLRQRNHEPAKQSFQEARRLFNSENDRMGEGNALLNYGECCAKLTQNEESSNAYDQARFLFTQSGDRTGEAHALYCRAELDRQTR